MSKPSRIEPKDKIETNDSKKVQNTPTSLQEKGNENSGSGSVLYRKPLSERMLLMFSVYVLMIILAILFFIVKENPKILELKMETLEFLNEAANAFVLLLIPFVFGTLGASARILLSGLILWKHSKVALSSGLFATFSWIGLKSKVFVTLLTPYVERISTNTTVVAREFEQSGESSFYSMVFVAIMVGMFSSNIYIFINQRVEQLTQSAQSKNSGA